VHFFGGTTHELICHNESEYCAACTPSVEWVPFSHVTLECGWAPAGLASAVDGRYWSDRCDGSSVQACGTNTPGINILQSGTVACGGAQFSGHDYRYEQDTCEIRVKDDYQFTTFVQRLYECDPLGNIPPAGRVTGVGSGVGTGSFF
jgi:hypothetical protein